MRTLSTPVWLAVAALFVSLPAGAEFYKWTDPDGTVHFTSDPSEVPAARREQARDAGSSGRGSYQRVETTPRDQAGQPGGAAAAGDSLAPPAATAPAAHDESDDEAANPRFGGRTEAQWRALATKYRSEIERLETASEACADDEFRWTIGAGRRAYEEEQREAEACQRQVNELDMNRRWLEKLEDNAHRAGAPPGWLRD